MSFVFSFLGACLGIIAAIFIIIMIIFIKVRSMVGPVNFKELIKAAKNVKNIERQEYMREKDVS